MNSAARLVRLRLLPVVERHGDLAAGFLLFVFTLVSVWPLVGGGTVVGKDTITQYYTWYSYLVAAGLLPRLEFQTLSTLADGYGNIEGVRAAWGGWTSEDWRRLLTPGLIYPGLTVLALALAAPLVARERHAVPFFFVLSVCTLVLSSPDGTPLHSVLYFLLPGFEWLHPHGLGRIKVVLYLGLALLAGATLSSLGGRNVRTLVVFPVLTSLSLAIYVAALLAAEGPPAEFGIGFSLVSLLALAVANACVVVYALSAAGRRGAAFLIVLVLFVDPFAAGRATLAERATADIGKDLVKVDLARFFEPTGAAKFLHPVTENGPARYFGYGPHHRGDGWSFRYNNYFAERNTSALLASNMGTPLGLQSIQGYNAVHIARYDEYIEEINGRSQGYHNADVVPQGLDSPLLDLLNVRYVVVPADVEADQDELLKLKDAHPTVYEDDRVEVLENLDALPRAWIVHSAREAPRGEALEQLGASAVDPRQTALLERTPPDLDRPENPSADRATVTEYEADRISLETETGARGLLVLSETYYPAWKAYVDGEPVPLYVADHVLRSVPVPAGEHTVELRYESWSLRIGVAISLGFCLALIALVAARARRWRKDVKGTPAGDAI